MKEKPNGVYFSGYQKEYYYVIDGKKSLKGYDSQFGAAKAFVNEYIVKYPKYKDAIAGKKWTDIFRMFNLKVNGPQNAL